MSAGGARRARHWRLHLAVIIGLVIAFGVIKLADTFNHAGMAAAAAARRTTVNKILGGGWLLTVLVVTVIAFAVMSVMAAAGAAAATVTTCPAAGPVRGAGDDRGHEGPRV